MDGLGLEAGPAGRVRVVVGRSVASASWFCEFLMDGSWLEMGQIGRIDVELVFFLFFFLQQLGVLG